MNNGSADWKSSRRMEITVWKAPRDGAFGRTFKDQYWLRGYGEDGNLVYESTFTCYDSTSARDHVKDLAERIVKSGEKCEVIFKPIKSESPHTLVQQNSQSSSGSIRKKMIDKEQKGRENRGYTF